MIITAVTLILPTALYSTLSSLGKEKRGEMVLTFSRGSAGVMLILYVLYLVFQFKTHSKLFIDADADEDEEEDSTEEQRPSSNADTTESTSAAHIWTATVILLVAAACIMVCTSFLMDSVNDTAEAFNMTKRFIAAILMPIVSNAPEMASVIASSRTGKTGFAIGVIIGSILQISLLVIPFLVILGWIIQQPMTLNFETFQTTILFFAVLMVTRILRDIEYTYLQGVMLIEL